MKKILLFIFPIFILGLISCSQKTTTYKGKYENGMFIENPNRYTHKLGMKKVKKKKKVNIQKCKNQ